MSESTPLDRLQPALKKVQDELARHLDEACEAQPDEVTRGSVDQLLHLEEELLAAARAADEAVRLRRRLDERAAAGGASPTSAQRADSAPETAEAGGRVRDFRDRQRQVWRVWEVRPGLGRPVTDLHRYLGDYVNGWLAFACLDNDSRKRLPSFPPDWFEMSDPELEALLHRAVEVPRRKTVGSDTSA